LVVVVLTLFDAERIICSSKFFEKNKSSIAALILHAQDRVSALAATSSTEIQSAAVKIIFGKWWRGVKKIQTEMQKKPWNTNEKQWAIVWNMSDCILAALAILCCLFSASFAKERGYNTTQNSENEEGMFPHIYTIILQILLYYLSPGAHTIISLSAIDKDNPSANSGTIHMLNEMIKRGLNIITAEPNAAAPSFGLPQRVDSVRSERHSKFKKSI
jgi:hypothetical protein